MYIHEMFVKRIKKLFEKSVTRSLLTNKLHKKISQAVVGSVKKEHEIMIELLTTINFD